MAGVRRVGPGSGSLSMARRLFAFLAMLGILAGILTATSPSAWAIRDTGWWHTYCNNPDGWGMYVQERVIWYASDNHRYVEELTYAINAAGGSQAASILGFWVEPAGIGWINYAWQDNPGTDQIYATNHTPDANPWDGAYWLARGRDPLGEACDIQLFG